MPPREYATASPPRIIAAYLMLHRYPPQWRAHPACNPYLLMEAPTMQEAVEKVRRRFNSFERAEVVLLSDELHEYVVRRLGWSEMYGYYAGLAAVTWSRAQIQWRGPEHAKRMGVAQAYATASVMLESVGVEAWPKKETRRERPSAP